MDSRVDKKITAKIVKRFVIKAELVLLTPLVVGSGEKGMETDILIVKDENGYPYIPATSFVGVLRHWFEEKVGFGDKKNSEYFWGSKSSGVQSAFIVDDLYITKEDADKKYPKILARDGVKINPLRGTAEDKGKFSYELATPGTTFSLSLEVIIREGYNGFEKIIATILDGLLNDKVRFGAMTNKGFGKIKIKNLEIEVFDYSSKDDVIHWLFGGKGQEIQLKELGDPYPLKDDYLKITGNFLLQDSLIIRSYSPDINGPDSVHLQSFDEEGNLVSALPGTSIKGALRSRMEKILSTFGINPFENEEIKRFLGYVASGDKVHKNAYKSALMVNESVIIKPVRKLQKRTKIDRFTEGTVSGALFDEEPVWTNPVRNETYVTLETKLENLKENDWRAGLLLLSLKDLWNADLPIGGEKAVGRGLLKGKSISVESGNREIVFVEDAGNGLKITGDKEKLEEYVKGFVNFANGGAKNE